VTSCAEVREELVAWLRGESPPDVAADVERHLDRCPSCAAERDATSLTLDVVGEHVAPEVSADARIRLAGALDEELAKSRVRAKRRALLRLSALPVAASLGVVAALCVIATKTPKQAARVDVAREARIARAADVAGAFGEKAIDAASRGLAWLVASQRADGSWASSTEPSTGGERASAAASTASALLAFAADGQSPHHGPRAAALVRARDRLAELVDAGFSPDAADKSIYALALSVRALAADYRLDHDAMSAAERRGLRAFLADAGRRVVEWQGADGGFGYAPRSIRSDSACTLFAAAALKDLREAGVLDADVAIDRARSYLAGLPAADGGVAYMRPGDRSAPALTAAWLTLDGCAGAATSRALATVEKELAAGKEDSFLAWTGFSALARRGRTLEAPVKRLLDAQRPDGAWPSGHDERCATAGDAVTTAFGVLAMTQVYAAR